MQDNEVNEHSCSGAASWNRDGTAENSRGVGDDLEATTLTIALPRQPVSPESPFLPDWGGSRPSQHLNELPRLFTFFNRQGPRGFDHDLW